jgi:hypothetical protein
MVRFLRQLLPFTSVGLAVAALYLVWVGLSRQSMNRESERVQQQKTRKDSGGIPQELAGSDLKILHFYASPSEVIEGEKANVCYGVLNAAEVRLEPPVEELYPTLNRCVSVSPRRTGEYRLIAQSAAGIATASFSLKVKPPPPYITFLAISEQEVRRGQPITLCYGVKDTTSLRLDPGGRPLAISDRICTKVFPVRTTEYAITATGRDGSTDRLSVTITVH